MNWETDEPTQLFRSRLRERRKLLGFSQEEATKLLPEPAPRYWWVGRVENGEVKISTDRLAQLARIYRVTPNWLLGFENDDRYLDFNTAAVQILGKRECEKYGWDETVLALLIKAKMISGGVNYEGEQLTGRTSAQSAASV